MKLKDTYISHESDGEQVLVDTSCEFSGVIRNNSTSAFIVELLRHDTTLDEIADAMFEKYACAARPAARRCRGGH